MKINLGPMLNAYPDSLGGTLSDAVAFLQEKEVKGAFSSFYILPSLFNTDLDRGFSVIDYGINGVIAKEEDLEALQSMGIDLKLDFILNHLSVQSPQFQDLVEKGDASAYNGFLHRLGTSSGKAAATWTKTASWSPGRSTSRTCSSASPACPCWWWSSPTAPSAPIGTPSTSRWTWTRTARNTIWARWT